MIYLFGLSVALFLFVLILLKKNKTRPDYILLTWIGVIAFHLFLFLIHHNGVIYRYPHLLGVSLPLPILHGVFLYWYAVELINKDPVRVKVALLHLVPFLFLVILAVPFYRLPASEKMEVFQNEGRGFEWYSKTQMVAFLVAGFAYSIAAIVQIRKHRRRIVNRLSNIDKKMLRWLEFLAAGLAVIWLLSAFFDDTIVFGGVALFVLFIGFFGINQYPVFYSVQSQVKAETGFLPESLDQLIDEAGKYARSRLDDNEAASAMALLETVMQTQKPFRNPDLTLADLADSINVSPNDLSQVINTLGGKTFYHYINTYRIQEFLRLSSLPESRKFTYLGLAYQCGFTSKTTFNKYFKLQTGKTPSAYLGSGQGEHAGGTITEK
jgi:AraC-like DNA-binding protein